MKYDFDDVIYGFLVAAFGMHGIPQIAPDFEGALEKLVEDQALKVESLIDWPLGCQVGLAELLKSWLVALVVTSRSSGRLSVPDDWLFGTSPTRLNSQVVRELLCRSEELVFIYSNILSEHRQRLH